LRAGRAAEWLVVAVGVDGEFADELAGGGVEDADVQVLDKHQDRGPGVFGAGADVVELPADPEGELAGCVGPVGADAVVGVGGAVARLGFRAGGVGGSGRCPVWQGAVRAAGVVDNGERVEQGLQISQGGGLDGLGAEPVLRRLLEPLDFPLGLRVVRLAVLLGDAQAAQLGLQGVAAAPAAREPGSEDQPVEFLSGVKYFSRWS
jgi:hypothetical protein